ncbi:unnamed protein product [Durusdinium trenchii]|uniref:Uncharacterized protein n=1 Tax=Durusdinium trenchii TaxID=1381693 RepID=A0ABP0IUW3_9DINO
MEDFATEYDRNRAAAEVDESVLTHVHLGLELPYELTASEISSASNIDHPKDAFFAPVSSLWKPQGMDMLGPLENRDLSLSVDKERQAKSLSDTMDLLRDKIDNAFGWTNKLLSDDWQQRRAAAQATLLLLDQCADDGKSELLQTKAFTLLLGEKYRTHGEKLFAYAEGAWQVSSSGTLTAADLEFLTMALRRAQAYFVQAVGRNQVPRDFAAVVWELKVVFSLADERPLLEWQLGELSRAKPEQRSQQWWLGLAELARDLRKQLADHSKTLVRNFMRWSDSKMDSKRKPGIAFLDCYLSTSAGKVRQMKKDPRRDVDSDPSGPAEDIADTDCASREIGARSACSHDWSFFPPYTVNRFAAVSNPGVGQKTKGSTKRLRSECLQDASLRWPHLARTVLQPAGKSLKFQRRSVNVVKMERTLGSLCDAPCEVFGTWEHWAWPEDVTGEEPSGFDAGPPWEVQCLLDLEKLKAYSACAQDIRQDQLQRFLHLAQREGAVQESGYISLKQVQAPFREPKLAGRLLQESACFIRDSIAPGMQTTDFLRKYNDFDVVLALTDVGPKYLLKAQTVSFRRLKKNLYYNNKFVNVLMACMLQHRGKSEPTFLHLTEHFLARGSPCALLGTRNRLTRRTLMEEVWSLPSIQQFHSGLIGKNTEKGEWQILSHDATFKALFSVIGQRKMALAPGEGHALHSLLGLSGALAGLSLQHAEGPKCFADAVTSLLPDEDPLHFALRAEACFGEKRTALSRNLLHLQKKFAHALDCAIFKGGAAPKAHEGQWPARRSNPLHPDRNFIDYSQTPYLDHQSYIDDIVDLTLLYPDDMGRKNSKGQSVKQILITGSAYRHFAYLRNGCRAISALSRERRQLFSFGTAANEALHAQFNSSQSTVVQQHLESVQVVLKSFSCAKLLAHHSAAYAPTVAQRSQSQILALLEGALLRPDSEFCKPFDETQPEAVTDRKRLRRPVHAHDGGAAAHRAQLAARQREQWRKHLHSKKWIGRKWTLKRTVFTKKKHRAPPHER